MLHILKHQTVFFYITAIKDFNYFQAKLCGRDEIFVCCYEEEICCDTFNSLTNCLKRKKNFCSKADPELFPTMSAAFSKYYISKTVVAKIKDITHENV